MIAKSDSYQDANLCHLDASASKAAGVCCVISKLRHRMGSKGRSNFAAKHQSNDADAAPNVTLDDVVKLLRRYVSTMWCTHCLIPMTVNSSTIC